MNLAQTQGFSAKNVCKEEDRRKMKWLWLPQLQKPMAAFCDLGCSEL